MRSLDDWNDDLPDVNDQPGLPFDGAASSAAPATADAAAAADTIVLRPALEDFFDALVRVQRDAESAPDTHPVVEPLVAAAEIPVSPVAPSEPIVAAPVERISIPAAVEVDVVSMPVALVLRRPDAPAMEFPVFAPAAVAAESASVVVAPPAVVEESAPVVVALSAVAEESAPVVVAPLVVVEESAPVVVAPPVVVVERAPAVVATPVVSMESEPVVADSVEPRFDAFVKSAPVVAPPPPAPPSPFEGVHAAAKVSVPMPVHPPMPFVGKDTKEAHTSAITVKEPIKIKASEPVRIQPAVKADVAVPAIVPVVPVVPAARTSGGSMRYLAAAAAIVMIVAAIGIPMRKLWATPQPAAVVAEPQPVAVRHTPAPAPREKRPEPEVTASVTPAAEPAVNLVPVSAPIAPVASKPVEFAPKPKPIVPAPPRTIARIPTPATETSAVAVLASAATESVAVSTTPLVAPPPPAPAPVAKVAEEAPTPMGPFFELTQVDRAPKVLSRVEPVIPRTAPVQNSDIALVRVLVSQTGHPALVRLLRPSKGGVVQDDAIIAAVKQWKFSPASKRGEAVSCYLHVAVPLKAGQ